MTEKVNQKKFLILGGGFGGATLYQTLHSELHPCNRSQTSLELINRHNYLTFTPMLHEAATGSVSREHAVQALREIVTCPANDFHQAEILKVNPDQKTVETSEHCYSYDYLAVALGVRQSFFNTTGASEHAFALKDIQDAMRIRNRIITAFEHASEHHDKEEHAEVEKHLCFIIVGGGATGTELAGQLADLIRGDLAQLYPDVPQNKVQILLIEAGNRILSNLSKQASQASCRRLKQLDVAIRFNQTVCEITKNEIILSSGEKIPTHSVFWTAGTESQIQEIFPKKLLDDRGLIKTNQHRQVLDHPEIFAFGDCAIVDQVMYQTPPTAQAATWEAKLVAQNLLALHTQSSQLKARTFQSKGEIIPIGDWFAIFQKGNLIFTGKFAWWLRRTVFLQTMFSWGKRLRVVSDWTIQITQPRDTSEF